MTNKKKVTLRVVGEFFGNLLLLVVLVFAMLCFNSVYTRSKNTAPVAFASDLSMHSSESKAPDISLTSAHSVLNMVEFFDGYSFATDCSYTVTGSNDTDLFRFMINQSDVTNKQIICVLTQVSYSKVCTFSIVSGDNGEFPFGYGSYPLVCSFFYGNAESILKVSASSYPVDISFHLTLFLADNVPSWVNSFGSIGYWLLAEFGATPWNDYGMSEDTFIAFAPALEAFYSYGYQAGYDFGSVFGNGSGSDGGYDVGYEAGKTDGYNEGYAIGKQDGIDSMQSALKDEYDKGYTAGETAGYNQGYSKGNDDGYRNGWQVGFTNGKSEGYDIGKSEGYEEGFEDGKSEGYEVGKSEGYEEGFEVGKENALDSATVVATVNQSTSWISDLNSIEYSTASEKSFTWKISSEALLGSFSTGLYVKTEFPLIPNALYLLKYTSSQPFLLGFRLDDYSVQSVTNVVEFPAGSDMNVSFVIPANYLSSGITYESFNSFYIIPANHEEIKVDNVTLSLLFDPDKSYDIGYEVGYEEGVNRGDIDGYNRGYSTGYSAGLELGQKGDFFSLISAVIDTPVKAFTSLLDFEIFGYNMSSFAISLLVAALVVAVLRLFAGSRS